MAECFETWKIGRRLKQVQSPFTIFGRDFTILNSKFNFYGLLGRTSIEAFSRHPIKLNYRQQTNFLCEMIKLQCDGICLINNDTEHLLTSFKLRRKIKTEYIFFCESRQH